MNPFKNLIPGLIWLKEKYESDPTAFALATTDGLKPFVRMVC